MPDMRTVKKIFKWKPLTKKSQGRPRYKWEDNIKQDICQMKIKNWMACVQDQGKLWIIQTLPVSYLDAFVSCRLHSGWALHRLPFISGREWGRTIGLHHGSPWSTPWGRHYECFKKTTLLWFVHEYTIARKIHIIFPSP